MRRATRTDTNQSEIIQALRKHGASVQPIHIIGKGCPDLLVGFNGRNWLVEVKDGGKVPSQRRLTPDEAAWHRSWCGQVAIAESVEDAIALIHADSHSCANTQLLLEIAHE
jgi:hypothetical protein